MVLAHGMSRTAEGPRPIVGFHRATLSAAMPTGRILKDAIC
jgi:hypothetical protein